MSCVFIFDWLIDRNILNFHHDFIGYRVRRKRSHAASRSELHFVSPCLSTTVSAPHISLGFTAFFCAGVFCLQWSWWGHVFLFIFPALLEARGLSSQFLGGFSSRMHHLNERAAASAATGRLLPVLKGFSNVLLSHGQWPYSDRSPYWVWDLAIWFWREQSFMFASILPWSRSFM